MLPSEDSQTHLNHSYLADTVGSAIRNARHAQGLSQEQVAHLAGIAVATYSCLEYGSYRPGKTPNPTLATLARVLSVLDLNLTLIVK